MSMNRYQVEERPYMALSIVAVVFSVILAPVGIILAVIARVLQRRAGSSPDLLTTIALALGVMFFIIGFVLVVAVLVGLFTVTTPM